MSPTYRRATIAAAVALALPVGVSAARAATPVSSATCRASQAQRMTHTAWLQLLRGTRSHYGPSARQAVWHGLTSRPNLAFPVLNRWDHGTAVRIGCRPQARPTVHASLRAQIAPGSGHPAPDGVPGTWTLKWSDEFSGTSLDSSKWSKGWFGSGVTQPVNSSEIAAYDPNNVTVSGGTLNIAAVHRALTVNGRTYPYSSGIVTTNGLYSFKYGVIEARIKLSGTGGQLNNWPAFWANGQNWPADGELDVMEGLGGTAAYHFHSNAGGPGMDVSGDFTGWHTYTADWQPGRVDYYYDGHEVGSITTGITSSPMYLVLDDAISGTSTGPTAAPDTMKVDYVRVWQ